MTIITSACQLFMLAALSMLAVGRLVWKERRRRWIKTTKKMFQLASTQKLNWAPGSRWRQTTSVGGPTSASSGRRQYTMFPSDRDACQSLSEEPAQSVPIRSSSEQEAGPRPSTPPPLHRLTLLLILRLLHLVETPNRSLEFSVRCRH